MVQLIVQALNAVAGFLMVRSLDKPNYAWFTIISGMSAALSVLADSGIGSAVTAIGGSIWQDKKALSSLITAALKLRLKMAALAALLVAPLSVWMLMRNNAPLSEALILTVIVLLPIWHLSTAAVLNVVNRLYSRTWQLQIADLAPALIRALLTLLLVAVGLISPLSAVLALLVSQAIQYFIVHQQVRPYISETPDLDAIQLYSGRVLTVIKQLYPNCLFVCIQGQLATWLISIFATTNEVADLGALNRLGIIFAVLGGPVGQYIAPAFARTQIARRLKAMFGTVLTGYILFCTLFLIVIWLKGDLFLWLLGDKYQHLHAELLLVVLGMSLASINSIVWALNFAKGWVCYAWLSIPLTIFSQVASAFFIPLNSVSGLALFTILSSLVQLCHALAICISGLLKLSRGISTQTVLEN
jgi:O-antigen/teichoic acid export membrane protein